MRKFHRLGTSLALAAMLASCGGGGGSSSGGTVVVPTPTSSTPAPSTTAGCSLRERQDWAAAQLNEWYLFPDTLPSSPNPASYGTVQDYIDYLTSGARAKGYDRYFTYVTSIKEETAYYNSGSNAGYGFRLAVDAAGGRVFIAESFENTPALNAGIDRGTELLAIGTSASNLTPVSSLVSSSSTQGLYDALGPADAGVTRYLQFRNLGGTTKTVAVTKADYALLPVSGRYGAKILDNNGVKTGYINLRTFIETADPALRSAFANFRSQGVTNVVVDLRYNGGGLVKIADLMTNLMGGDRRTSDVLSYTTFRPSKSSENSTEYFAPQPQSITPMKLAFIGTRGTASASELVINALRPYRGANEALVGTNTYGKPVGQIALDKTACDDRLRVIAFKIENANHQGEYFNGLAPVMEVTCKAGDDLTLPLGDPREASIAAALDFLAGRACTPITAGTNGVGVAGMRETPLELPMPNRPSTAQRETPGLI